jgi:hypothetical protein
MRYRGIAVLSLVWALISACGSSDSDDPSCVPGESTSCTGPNGCEGYQVCNDDGTGYEPCECGGGSSGTGGGGSGTGGGGSGTGGGGTQSGTGGSSATGGAGVGSGGLADSGGTGGVLPDCEPADMTDWTPPAYVPARVAQHVCSEAIIRQYVTDCLNGTDCAPFEAGGEHAACAECLTATPVGESEYGPLILSGSLRETNFAGCIELLGEADCAVHLQARSACEREACLNNCPVTDSQSLTLYQQCKQEAGTGVCATYRQEAVCITDPAHSQACSGGTFEDGLAAIGSVFCGG